MLLESLTTPRGVGINSNMKARLLLSRRTILDERIYAELVLWQVPQPVKGGTHGYKYRLALISDDKCVLRYDNEARKGDHVHRNGVERAYRFVTIDKLLADFEADIKRWLDDNRDA